MSIIQQARLILKPKMQPRSSSPEVIVISSDSEDDVLVLPKENPAPADAESDADSEDDEVLVSPKEEPADAESDTESEPPFESKTGLTKQEIMGVFEIIREKHEAKQEKEAVVAWGFNRQVVAAQMLKEAREEIGRYPSRGRQGQGSSRSTVPDKGEEGLLMIPPVSPIPTSTYWVSIPANVHVNDAQRLDFVPYLGDVSDNEREEFTDKLFETYEDSQLMHLLYDQPRMNDDMFFELTVQLARKEEERNRRLQFNSAAGPSRRLKSGVGKDNDPKKIRPSPNLLLDMASLFKQLGTPDQILERFQDIVTKKSGGPKIDDPRVQLQSPEKTIDSFKTLFCNRCKIYHCFAHTKEDIIRPDPKPVPATESFTCKNPECWRLSEPKPTASTSRSTATASSSSKSSSEWSIHDLNIFAVLFQRYSSDPDPCKMALSLLNRTCREVKEVMDRHRAVKTPSEVKEGKKESVAKPEVTNGNGKGKQKKKPKNRKISTFIRNSSLIYGKSVNSDSSQRYLPCDHEGDCSLDKNCGCVERGTPCEKFCTCSKDCKRRFPGCTCSAAQPCRTSACLCLSAHRECDPSLCNCCKGVDFNQDQPNAKCCNLSMTLKKDKHVSKGVSNVSGWGLFAKEDIQDGEFITEFRGEILSQAEVERRELLYDRNCHTFVFDLNNDFVVDAMQKGNTARFINSSRNPNCISKQVMVNGDHRLGIYAKCFIQAGSELFFNYQHVLKRHQEISKSSKKSKKKKSK